ncbi:MAG: LacI family DNA-binding transcriptional regulator [Spirulinaceae cyanobacterium SM2_1_0]|nr:LacI family DNA-binding transcriptional regulator [Spirulinaceae cyanobacterium SM2_1_0]
MSSREIESVQTSVSSRERFELAVRRMGFSSQAEFARAAHVSQATASRVLRNPAQLFARALMFAAMDKRIGEALDDIWQAEREKWQR